MKEPFLAFGFYAPVVAHGQLAGLYPQAGVAPGPLRADHERTAKFFATNAEVFYVNRRPGMAPGTTMAEIAAVHAAAIRDAFGGAVNLLGMSTGGSIAQQIAAEHPDVVSRLVLVSTGTGSVMVPGRFGVLARMATTRRFSDPSYAASIIGDMYGGSARTHPDRVLQLLGDTMRPASRIKRWI